MTAALTELLTRAQVKACFYDLGRRPYPLSLTTFGMLENQQRPYPYPLRGQAHLALCCQRPSESEPSIWFLQINLDERGLLIPEECARFARLLLNTLGADLSREPQTEEEKNALAQHPQHWQPSSERMAMFHALLARDLHRPASRYYEHAQFYLSGKAGWENWHGVGLQGLADVVVRCGQEQNHALLCQALAHAPEQALQGICLCLEQSDISREMAQVLLQRQHLQHQNPEADTESRLLLLRALAYAPDLPEIRDFITQQLRQADVNAWLIVLTARLIHRLSDPQILPVYLEALAGSPLFGRLYPEVITQPFLRSQIFAMLQSESAPRALIDALTALQQQLQLRAE